MEDISDLLRSNQTHAVGYEYIDVDSGDLPTETATHASPEKEISIDESAHDPLDIVSRLIQQDVSNANSEPSEASSKDGVVYVRVSVGRTSISSFPI